MTIHDLAQLVRAMRTAQKRYFRDRDPETLDMCKRLEREVDAAVALALDAQRTLFDGGDANASD